MTAPVQANESVLVQVTYDVAWHAYSNNQPLPIRRDPLGQMIIDAPPGQHTIELVFETPLENSVGKGITLASCGLVGLLLLSPLRRKRN